MLKSSNKHSGSLQSSSKLSGHGFHIAIDGPVAAGKSTVAKKLAEKIGFLYIDTGSMYRAVTLGCLQNKVNIQDQVRVAKCLSQLDIKVLPPLKGENHHRHYTVILDGQDVSHAIRTSQIDEAVPIVASYPKVRAALVAMQRSVARGKDIVMEGRDITYRVLPKADLKIYLTANEVVRAHRHYQELAKVGEQINFEDVLKALLKRDLQDMSRKTDPLKVVEGAWILDTSSFSIDEVVELIVEKINHLQSKK